MCKYLSNGRLDNGRRKKVKVSFLIVPSYQGRVFRALLYLLTYGAHKFLQAARQFDAMIVLCKQTVYWHNSSSIMLRRLQNILGSISYK